MKLHNKRFWGSAAVAIALTGCGGSSDLDTLPPVSPSSAGPAYGAGVSDSPVLVGDPYEVNGVTYTPVDAGRYDEVGLASYYGNELGGRPTANGERFNPSGISAAHRTLPLPSYVEVTSLQTGQTILVRINDRGPFAGDRIIDLSSGAARQLGILDQGTAAVRVRRVEPIEADKARLRSGQSAQDRLPTSPQLLTALRAQFERGGGVIPDAAPPSTASATTTSSAPAAGPAGVTWQDPNAGTSPPTATATSSSASAGYYVQLGAFSNAANAQRAASRAASLGNVVVVQAGNVRRVRIGPFPTEAAANAALPRARSGGFSGARVFRDTGR